MSYLKDKINQYKAMEQQINEIHESNMSQEQRLKELGKETFDFRLGDLIRSLSEITGIEEENMYVKIDYNDVWILEDSKPISYYKREKKPLLRLTIASRMPHTFSLKKPNDSEFYYNFFFQGDFNELQADDHSLLEHSYTIRVCLDSISQLRIQTSLYIADSQKEDIICHIKLKDLASSKEFNNHFPNDLLLQALDNIEISQDQNKQEKVKQLTI